MTMVTLQTGLIWPHSFAGVSREYGLSGTTVTLNAAGAKTVMTGKCYIDGRPSSPKTISAAGGGSISFRCGAATFANVATFVDVGIQDVDTANGPPGRGDGTFDVVKTCATPSIGAGWNSVSMTGGSGSKSIAHGDMIAIVWDMTARGGVDTIRLDGGNMGYNTFCGFTSFLSSVWANLTNASPNVVIAFDDGTLATLDGTLPISTTAPETFSNSTNPDERGLIFRVPFACKVDAIVVSIGVTDLNSDLAVALYSNPLTGPTIIGGPLTPSHRGFAGTGLQAMGVLTFPAEVSLAANTDYCVTLRAQGTTAVRINTAILGSAAHRVFWPGGTTNAKATRDNFTGNFTTNGAILPEIGVRISSVDDGTGTGGAPGHGNMSGGLQ